MSELMSFERKVLIHSSPEAVFAVLSDLGQSRQWMHAIQRIEGVTPGPFKLGTEWTESRKAGKRTMVSKVRVASFEPSTRLGLEVDGGMMKGQMTFTLEPRGNGAEVTYRAQMTGKGFFRLMTGKMNKMMAAEDDDILERLRKQVEGGHS